MATTTRRTKAAAPAPEPEVDEEFDELEEDDLEELEEVEEAPAPKARKKATAQAPAKADGDKPKRSDKIEFGSPWLAAHVTEVTGQAYDSRAIRMLLRKLAKDGVLDREVGETRDRYVFTGADDKIVKAVVEMVTSGAAKELKQAGLQAVKDNAAAKKAAAKAAKEAAAEAEDDEIEELDDDEVEEEEEEVEEAPKPTRTRRAPAKTPGPAKATAAAPRGRRAPAAK